MIKNYIKILIFLICTSVATISHASSSITIINETNSSLNVTIPESESPDQNVSILIDGETYTCSSYLDISQDIIVYLTKITLKPDPKDPQAWSNIFYEYTNLRTNHCVEQKFFIPK